MDSQVSLLLVARRMTITALRSLSSPSISMDTNRDTSSNSKHHTMAKPRRPRISTTAVVPPVCTEASTDSHLQALQALRSLMIILFHPKVDTGVVVRRRSLVGTQVLDTGPEAGNILLRVGMDNLLLGHPAGAVGIHQDTDDYWSNGEMRWVL